VPRDESVPCDKRREMIVDEGFKKLEKEVNDMNTVMDSQVKRLSWLLKRMWKKHWK